jgi:hypothetical protein
VAKKIKLLSCGALVLEGKAADLRERVRKLGAHLISKTSATETWAVSCSKGLSGTRQHGRR